MSAKEAVSMANDPKDLNIGLTELHSAITALHEKIDKLGRPQCNECSCGPCIISFCALCQPQCVLCHTYCLPCHPLCVQCHPFCALCVQCVQCIQCVQCLQCGP